MKVIDLLNKIANGEEVPKKLKIKKWEYDIEYENLKYELFDRLFEEDFELNDEIEIIEEDKKIAKLPYYDYKEIMSENNRDKFIEKLLEKHDKRLDDYHEKINEIINYLEENK